MGFLPDTVSDHPFLSALGILLVLGVLGVLAINFSQGTFVDDQGCKWVPVDNPETGEPFNSVNELENYHQDQGETVPDSLELEVRDGVLHKKLKCVNFAGENTQ